MKKPFLSNTPALIMSYTSSENVYTNPYASPYTPAAFSTDNIYSSSSSANSAYATAGGNPYQNPYQQYSSSTGSVDSALAAGGAASGGPTYSSSYEASLASLGYQNMPQFEKRRVIVEKWLPLEIPRRKIG